MTPLALLGAALHPLVIPAANIHSMLDAAFEYGALP
jgi:hypothetical protein